MAALWSILKSSQGSFSDKGSKFVGYAIPAKTIADAKEFIGQIKSDNHKARHVCFAYRIGTESNIYRVYDDGEPSGSAGKPILGQIDKNNLTNILVAVVRFFGGTKLGLPRLANAYKQAAAEALLNAKFVEIKDLVEMEISFPYNVLHLVMPTVKQDGISILNQRLKDDCYLKISFSRNRLFDLRNQLTLIKEVKLDES